METRHQFRPWKKETPPASILVIRFQAFGDTMITLPYLHDLIRSYPNVRIDFLTRREVATIPICLKIFHRVISIGGKRNVKLQLLLLMLMLPGLWLNRYDAVIDLQNNRVSKLVRKLLGVRSWSEFDNHSPVSAGIRTQNTINLLWRWHVQLNSDFLVNTGHHSALLRSYGFIDGEHLVVLNPAGYCPSRNWPVEYYIQFATDWLKVRPCTRFVLLLTQEHKAKGDMIARALNGSCIDLTGRADQWDAFGIIKLADLVVSEDSGLMHLAWIQRVPTIALFSSSRKDWSAPQGEWSFCFDSSDMECGPCHLHTCAYNDNRCLTRITPDLVLSKAVTLLEKSRRAQPA